MRFEDFQELVSRRRADKPIWFAISADDAPDNETLENTEAELNVTLPKEYKKFLIEFGGGYFALSNVFSLQVGSDWNLLEKNKRHADILQGHIIISENGVGDFFGFKIDNGACSSKVRFFDHEECAWKPTKYDDLLEYLSRFALSEL